MLDPKRKLSRPDIFLIICFFLIHFTCTAGAEYKYVLFSSFFLLVLLAQNKIRLVRQALPFFICYCLIFIVQTFTLPYVSYSGALNNLCRYMSGALMFIYFGIYFRKIYFNIIFLVSFSGLFPWLLYLTTGISFDLINNYQDDIIFWSMRPGEIRNSGPFHEPGAYVGYLIMVPLFYLNAINQFYKKYKFKVWILVVSLLTSMSTQGYLTFIVLIFYIFFIRTSKLSLPRIILLISFISITYYSIEKIDFLGDKLTRQTEHALEAESGTFSNTRLGSFLFDWYYIKKHPFFGNGFAEETRYADHRWLIQEFGTNLGNGNAFSNFWASCGAFFLIGYYFFVFKRLRLSFKTKDTIAFLVILTMMFQGEQFLFAPLFLGLTCLTLPNIDVPTKKREAPSAPLSH